MGRKFQFDRDQARREAARDSILPKPATGVHAFLVQEVTLTTSSAANAAGTFQAIVKQQSLTDPDDSGSVRGRQQKRYIDLPVTNPDYDGHQYPKWATARWGGFLSALGLVDPIPTFNRMEKQWYQGDNQIEKSEKDNLRLEVLVDGKEKAYDMLESEDFSELVGKVYFSDISINEKGYVNYTNDRASLADGESLVEGDGMAEDTVDAEESIPEPEPARKTVAKATPAKKGRK